MTDAEHRAINAEVAERVMGVVPRPVRLRGSDGVVTVWTDNRAITDGVWAAHELRFYRDPRPYSTDVGDAWAVVERLREAKWPCLVTLTQYRGGDYHCTIESDRDGERLGRERWSALAPTMPLAVCRAALAAFEARTGGGA